jgi:hypothetical protein
MTREEAIAELLKPHQPLGPFQDPADPDERQEAWARNAGLDVLDAMIDLAVHPPGAARTGGLSPQAFEFELARVLSLVGAQHERVFLGRAQQLLRDPTARATIIDALALMETQQSRALLIPLVKAPDLTEEEAIRLADTFGEMGGPAAVKLLEGLRSRTPKGWAGALREIEIAMRYARPRGSNGLDHV